MDLLTLWKIFLVTGFLFILPLDLSAQRLPKEAAKTQSIITGRMVGHDGKPMVQAVAVVGESLRDGPVTSAEATNDGRFRLALGKTGLFFVVFAGVNHLPQTIALWLDQPKQVSIDVRLSEMVLN